jgi:quercetin dioxygenase-like cupin family protein
MLAFDASAEQAKLVEQAAASRTGRAAKTLVKEGRLRATLIALRKGTALGAHHVDGDVTLHVLKGEFEVRTQGRTVTARKDGIVVLSAGVKHEAIARRDTTVLITTAMR